MTVYDQEKTKPAEKEGSHDDLGVHPEHAEAEAADLEKDFNAPSYSPKDLNDKETAAGTNEPSLYNPGKDAPKPKKGIRGWSRRKKSVFAGIIISALVSAFSFLFVSGPLQFIHIAQLLQKFHFSEQEDGADSRLTKLSRYIKYGEANRERTRMSVVGNKWGDAFEKRLNKSGLKTLYEPATRKFSGYIIDTDQLPDGHELKGKTNAELKDFFKKNYQIDLDTSAPRPVIGDDKIRKGKLKVVTRMLLKNTNLSKVTSAIGTRPLVVRSGSVSWWHPMRKTAEKLDDAGRKAWHKARKSRVTKGEGVGGSATGEKNVDEDGNETPNQETERTATDTNETIGDAKQVDLEIGTGSGPSASSKAKFKAKLTSVTMVIGIYCMIKALNENYQQLVHDKVVLPLIRLSMESISVGNQVMNGEDFSEQELSLQSESLYGSTLPDEKPTSWASARSIQAEQGEALAGPDILEEARIPKEKNFLSKILNFVPFGSAICKAASSFLGTIITFAIDIAVTATGIGGVLLAAFGNFVAPHLIGPFLTGLMNALSGNFINTAVKGADFGNYINHGARLAANDSYIAFGGRELSPAESAFLKKERLEVYQQDQSNKSFAQRYFDVYDSDSVASRLIDKQASSASGSATQLASGLLNIGENFGSIFKVFGSVFSRPAAAAISTGYDYGFPEFGFSASELDDTDLENPFENADKVANILDGSKGEEFIGRARLCFGVTISSDAERSVSANIPDATVKYSDLKPECKDTDKDWLRLRMYIFDSQVIEAASCYEGDEESCARLGFGVGSPPIEPTVDDGDLALPSDNIACAAGTRDVGVHTGYVDDVAIQIRLCALPDLTSTSSESQPGTEFYITGANGNALINSRISANVLALVTAADAAGVSLSAASSFRTMEHQQNLCASNPGCNSGSDYSAIAKPGTSQHQAGLAIDYNLGPGFPIQVSAYSTANGRDPSQNNPRVATRSRIWKWLKDNASQYGIKQYWNEPWHWSPNGK